MATKKPTPAPKEAAKDAAADAPDGAAAPKKRGKGKLIAILAGVILLVAGGGGAAAWYLKSSPAKHEAAEGEEAGDEATEEHEPEKKAEPKKAPVFVTLDPFTVNLLDDETPHYLQVAVVLSVTEPTAVDSIKVHMPIIRNGILLLLSNKRSEELGTLTGKQALAVEIATEAAKPLVAAGLSQPIEGVYFSSFVIQ